MGILKTVVKASVAKSVIRTAGDVATKGIVAINEQQKKCKVHVPKNAESYRGNNYLTVAKELEAYGFENIGYLEKKKELFTKHGEIAEISIDGKTNFRKNASFNSNVRVVITYYVSKKR